MNVNKAEQLALAAMNQHGLEQRGWVFQFDKASRRFGLTQHKKKTISLSMHLTELNDEVHVVDTILHEIAHALAGSGVGHSRRWRTKALEVGCKPKRCYGSDVQQPVHKWIGVCPNGHEVHRMKRMRLSCSRCCPRFSLDHLFEWKRNTQAT